MTPGALRPSGQGSSGRRRYGRRSHPTTRHVIATPLGCVEIVTEEGRLEALRFTDARPTPPSRDPIVLEVRAFFRGECKDLSDIPVDLSWATGFERQVYAATRCIPFGKVATYSQIAKAIGHPRAHRAVGNALGKCPVDIVIPAHRVIATDGLGGSTNLVEWKKKLLRFEGVLH